LSLVFKPHDYQKQAIRHLYDVPRAALWMPMGGGKSVSTLTALNDLSLVEDVFPVLVLAPLRVVKSVWPAEVKKWKHTEHLRVSIVTGSVKEREAALKVDADIYCMNYDNLVWLVEFFGKDWPFRTVVADEFSRLKSFRIRQGSKRAGALGKVAHAKVTRFIGLTGTPSPNGLKDLWGPAWFLDRGQRLGSSFTAFTDRWFRLGFNGYDIEPMPYSQGEIEDKLKDLCLTVAGLPVEEPIFSEIYVDLPPRARAIYNDMEKEMFAQLAEHGVEASNAAIKTIKCQQLASGAIYVDDKLHWEEVHTAKIEALESLVEEAGGAPVLVAYNFKSDLARLAAAFPKARVLDKDPRTIADWNAGKISLLLAQPISCGHGINLAEGGNILVFFSLDWNLETHLQIIERIGPMRQKQAGIERPVFVYCIMARSTVDSLVLERLRTKKSVQEILLEAMKRPTSVAD
jgi:SNF2 family DNA or RNA helicase